MLRWNSRPAEVGFKASETALRNTDHPDQGPRERASQPLGLRSIDAARLHRLCLVWDVIRQLHACGSPTLHLRR